SGVGRQAGGEPVVVVVTTVAVPVKTVPLLAVAPGPPAPFASAGTAPKDAPHTHAMRTREGRIIEPNVPQRGRRRGNSPLGSGAQSALDAGFAGDQHEAYDLGRKQAVL